MKTLPRRRAAARVLPIFTLILAACGEPTPPAPPPQPTDTPSATPAPTVEATPAPTASASASASASAAPSAAPRAGSGRPAVLKADPKEITDTFGSPPAKLELGEKEIATLRLPEGALSRGTVITFKIDARGKAIGGQIGKIYSILALVPPSTSREPIASSGPPFELELPAGSKKDANLAIGVEDDKGKIKWTIVAPKRIDDARGMAVFQLETLPSGWLHVTTKPPTAK